jgi:hypothetical protein
MNCVWPDEPCDRRAHRMGLCEPHFVHARDVERLDEFEQYRVAKVIGPTGVCKNQVFPERPCGTRGLYTGGCRGERCREAARVHKARQREAQRPQIRPDLSWLDDAPPCAGRDDLFFPAIDLDIDCGYRRWNVDGQKGHNAKLVDPYAAARRLCAGCPMQPDCLKTALSYGASNQWGFVGGLDAWERRRLLPRVRRKVAA